MAEDAGLTWVLAAGAAIGVFRAGQEIMKWFGEGQKAASPRRCRRAAMRVLRAIRSTGRELAGDGRRFSW